MPRRASMFVFLGLAVALVLVRGISAGAAPDGSIRAKKADIAGAQDRLMEIRMQASAAEASYNNALYEMNQLNGQISRTTDHLRDAKERLAGAKENLEERAAQVYKSGNVAFIDVLVGVDNFSEFASRLDLWVRLLDRERAEFLEVRAARNQLAERRGRLEAQREQRVAAVETAIAQKERADNAEARAEAYLNSLNAELREAIRAAQDRQAAQARAAVAAIVEKAPERIPAPEGAPAAEPEPVPVEEPEPIPEVEVSQVKQAPVPRADLQSEQAAAEREAAARAAAKRAQRLAEQRAAERQDAREAAEQAAEQAAAEREATRMARMAAERDARQEAREEAQRRAELAAERAAEREAAREEAEREAERAAQRATIEKAAAEQAAAEREAARMAAERRAEQRAAERKAAEASASASASASAAAIEEATAQQAAERRAEQQEAEANASASAAASERAAEQRAAEREAAEASASASASAPSSQDSKRGGSGDGGKASSSASASASASSSAAPGGGGGGASGGSGDDVLAVAQEHMGTPYVLSPPGPCTAFEAEDCSCFTMLVFQEFGIALPDTPGGQMGYGTPVQGAPQAGDLLFWSEDGSGTITHVGIAMGDGTTIHASNYAREVTITNINYINGYVGARRLI